MRRFRVPARGPGARVDSRGVAADTVAVCQRLVVVQGVLVASRAATDTFSTWTSSMWVAQLRISGRICSVSVLIVSCAGISALPTRVHRPSEFHGHRAPFTNPAPAQRFAICVFLTPPCGPRPCQRRRVSGILESQYSSTAQVRGGAALALPWRCPELFQCRFYQNSTRIFLCSRKFRTETFYWRCPGAALALP